MLRKKVNCSSIGFRKLQISSKFVVEASVFKFRLSQRVKRFKVLVTTEF